jgi:proteasome lid subunit RPN8/RPN11
MDIEVTSQALAAMRAAAVAAHPREACGILLGEGGRITAAHETANVHPAPETHFEVDPQALVDAHRAARRECAPQVVGYFHSHPSGPASPSATDRASASGDGRVWAIIAGNDVQFWKDGDSAGNGGFAALSFAIIDG